MRVAVLTGQPLSDISDMSAHDYFLWQAYMQLNPPNGVEMLLAQLCTMFANAHKEKNAPPAKLFDFAPWLEDFEERKQRLAEEEKNLMIYQNQLAGKLQLEKIKRQKVEKEKDGSLQN